MPPVVFRFPKLGTIKMIPSSEQYSTPVYSGAELLTKTAQGAFEDTFD